MEAPAARIVKGLYVLGMAVFFLLQATVSIKTYLAREVVSPSFKNKNRRKKMPACIFSIFPDRGGHNRGAPPQHHPPLLQRVPLPLLLQAASRRDPRQHRRSMSGGGRGGARLRGGGIVSVRLDWN